MDESSVVISKGFDRVFCYCYLSFVRYCQQNLIRDIEGLDTLVNLDALNLANNSIRKISGLSHLTNLKTLTITHNRIKDADDLRGVLECPSLTVLDVSLLSLSSL